MIFGLLHYRKCHPGSAVGCGWLGTWYGKKSQLFFKICTLIYFIYLFSLSQQSLAFFFTRFIILNLLQMLRNPLLLAPFFGIFPFLFDKIPPSKSQCKHITELIFTHPPIYFASECRHGLNTRRPCQKEGWRKEKTEGRGGTADPWPESHPHPRFSIDLC